MKSRALRVEVLEKREVCAADTSFAAEVDALNAQFAELEKKQQAFDNARQTSDVETAQKLAQISLLGAQLAANHPLDAAEISKLIGQAVQSTANANAMVAKIQAQESVAYANTTQKLVMVATSPGDNKIQRLDSIGKNFGTTTKNNIAAINKITAQQESTQQMIRDEIKKTVEQTIVYTGTISVDFHYRDGDRIAPTQNFSFKGTLDVEVTFIDGKIQNLKRMKFSPASLSTGVRGESVILGSLGAGLFKEKRLDGQFSMGIFFRRPEFYPSELSAKATCPITLTNGDKAFPKPGESFIIFGGGKGVVGAPSEIRDVVIKLHKK